MATKDPNLTLRFSGGAIKWADKTAAFPTDAEFAFNPTVWHDLGAIKTNPSMSTDITTTDVPFWNMDDMSLPGSTKYRLSFGSGQFDWENYKMLFNFDEIDEDGGFTPGPVHWEGQLAVVLFTATTASLLHAPNCTYVGKGNWDFLKNDVSEITSEFALNPDTRLAGGRPWRYVPGTPLVPQGV